MKKTRANYKEYLDEIAPEVESDEWIIGGKRRRGSYGNALRKHDPIAFEVGYREWQAEMGEDD